MNAVMAGKLWKWIVYTGDSRKHDNLVHGYMYILSDIIYVTYMKTLMSRGLS